MSNEGKTERVQKVATPPFLHQRLQSYRMGAGDQQTYVLRDTMRGSSYDFEPWQFFLLEVLPGCTEEGQLASVFEDRFARSLTRQERDLFFASLADAKLLNDAAASHPLLARFCRKTYVVDGEEARPRSHRAIVEEQAQNPTQNPAASAESANAGPGPAAGATVPAASAVRPAPVLGKIPDEDETLPAGMQDATDFDARRTRWMLVLFNPTSLLKVVTPLVSPLRFLIFLLPLAMLGALNLAARNPGLLEQDATRLLDDLNLVEHAIVSLLTVNLLVTFTTAVIAFKYRATVSGFGIALVMRFYPRFATRMSHLEQLSRVERMWLHGGPLLVRLGLFCVGTFVWYATHHTYEQIPSWGLAMAVTAAVSFLFTANPVIKSSGYHLLCAFTNEPHLRGKAFKALINKLRGGAFKEASELLLATYAITIAAFMFLLVAGAASFVGFALHEVHLGGSAIIIALIVGFMLLRRVLRYFGRVEAAYERSLQFDRWRSRTHGKDDPSNKPAAPRAFASYVWRTAGLMLLVAIFLPYSYQSGGSFVVHPRLQQVITTDMSGRIEEVFYDGGETVPEGAIVARLDSSEQRAQATIYEMKMVEQEAVIDHLRSLPRAEDVELARMALKVEETRVKASRRQLARIKSLTDQNFAPMEEYDNAKRQVDVDVKQLAEKRAALEVAQLGPTPFEIAAAEAKLESLRAERDAYLDRVRRSDLVMPFDGRLLTHYLKEKGNSYYKSGDAFADAEASGAMTAEIEVPESQVEYLVVGATVEFRPVAHSSDVFTGTVVQIDGDITPRAFGNVIKVIAALDEDGPQLKNGMTGYAKIDGRTLPVWEAFSRELLQFVKVQVWSWIP